MHFDISFLSNDDKQSVKDFPAIMGSTDNLLCDFELF